jgi:hypothetical protein
VLRDGDKGAHAVGKSLVSRSFETVTGVRYLAAITKGGGYCRGLQMCGGGGAAHFLKNILGTLKKQFKNQTNKLTTDYTDEHG